MDYLIQFLVLGVIFHAINFFFKKKKFLIDNYIDSKHKNFVNKDLVPLTGGILLLINLIIFIPEFDLFTKILFLLIFLLGLSSDTNKLNSPIKRLCLQIILSLIFIIHNKIMVNETNIFFIDKLISNFFFIKIFFTIFCIIILINGTNFIDGVNTLAAGYYIVVLFNLILIANAYGFILDYNLVFKLIVCLSLFFIYNFFSKSFLGDSGAYILSFLIGFLVINFANVNFSLSPTYVVLLLWYPAFENLFSILRRVYFEKKNVQNPDNYHLHHLLFNLLSKKFRLKNKLTNSITGIFINFFNLLIIFCGSFFVYESLKLTFIILFAVVVYLIIYIKLKKLYI